MPTLIFKLITKPIAIVFGYWMSLTDHFLSGGDRRKNLYVHVKDDPGVQKGLIFCSGFAFASFLWLGIYTLIFGPLPPSGETIKLGTYIITDFALDRISGASVPLFGIIAVVFLIHLNSVNERRRTLPALRSEGRKLFKRKK